jgi:DNA-nicking Smr family endonuclease
VAGRRISDDEAALRRNVASRVTPLRGKQPAPIVESTAPAKPKTTTVPAKRHAPAPVKMRSVSPDQPELAPGRIAGLDKRSAQRLKRGQTRPDARIDLHGMTQAEAHRALDDAVHRCRAQGRRCLLVITGKGSVTQGGVLRQMVPRWLNQQPLRAAILAIETAQPRDGGGGALYVLLKRQR